MSAENLPTVPQMFVATAHELHRAYQALGDAADWLRSDWQPLGSSLTDAQSGARSAVFDQIDVAKRAINKAKDAIDRAVAR